MEKFLNSYSGGMNKDLSPNKYPNTVYLDLKDFRIITNDSDGLTNGALTNVKGNALSFTFPTGAEYLGNAIIRDYMYLFTVNTGITDPDRIYRIPLTELQTAQDILFTDTYYFDSINTEPYTDADIEFIDGLVYKGDLGFDASYKIRAIGNYENSHVQKLYWVDGLNTLKHLNVVYNASTNDLENLDEELLSILPNHTYGTYDLNISIGGLLKSGKVQYSYQLYSVNGTETTYAPASPLLNLTEPNVGSNPELFYGSDIEANVNKSVVVTISLSSDYSNFNRIRLVALDYTTFANVPSVRIVSEQDINSSSITITDYGYSIGTLTLEEFQILRNDIIPHTLETKNNYLLAGNITEEFFDVDSVYLASKASDPDPSSWMSFLDTRAYRWKYSTTGATVPGIETLSNTTDPEAVANSNQYPTFLGTQINTSGSWVLRIYVDADGHASTAGVTFVNVSLASISTRNTYIGININSTDSVRVPTTGITNISYSTGTRDSITITGTGYVTSWEPLADYDVALGDTIEIPIMRYDYNYTTTSVSASVDCTINYDTTDQIVIDDGSGSGPDYTLVPETDDAINYFNDISNDTDSDYQYKYKQITAAAPPTSADLGGTGPLVSYTFDSESFGLGALYNVAPSTSTYFWKDNLAATSYLNPEVASIKVGLARDEVYRYGLVFYDLKGRPSFVKWIGDIRMPNWEEFPFVSNILSNISGYILYVNFQIDWTALPDGFKDLISGFKFVRVPRTDNDKTIKGMGVINPMYYDTANSNNYYVNPYLASVADYNTSSVPSYVGTDAAINKDFFSFISPQVAFNKQITTSTSAGFLQLIGYISDDGVYSNRIVDTSSAADNTNVLFFNTSVDVEELATTPSTIGGTRVDSSAVQIVGPEPYDSPAYQIGGLTFKPLQSDFDYSGGNDRYLGYIGTSLLVLADEFTTLPTATGDHECLYGVYRIYLGTSIYGGATYESRSLNNYISCSEFIETATTGDIAVYGGDNYINMFWYLYSGVIKETAGTLNSIQSYLTFPVESPINLSYRRDNLGVQVDMISNSDDYFITEYESQGLMDYGEYYPSGLGNLYRYNSVYSVEDKSNLFFPKPFDYVSSTLKDTAVTSSDLKFLGEYSDSWLKFRYNNYLELDTKYGEVIKLIHKDNRLFCFQPKAISLLSVLEREVVQTNNTQQLAVGTGGVLSRYDYITTESGGSYYDSIVPTEVGIYYYDDKNKNIRRIEESPVPLSDIKGMKSYIAYRDVSNCIAAYDRENREVVYSITDTTDGQLNALRYNGIFDFFEGFYGYKPSDYIYFDKYLLSSEDSNKFYLHNVGEYGVYYDQATPESSSLTIVINPAQNQVLALHILEWLTRVTNTSGTEQNTTTFTTLRVQNSYQDTGVITLNSTTNIKRRLRTWRMNILRDSSDRGRLRDSYFKVTLTFNNASNQKMVAHDILSDISPTKIR